jgi:DNA-binding NarL/FixJ family response regulator
VEAKINVFVFCCNRLLRESVARTLNKKADFQVNMLRSADCLLTAPLKSSLADSPASVLLLDSLQVMASASMGRVRTEIAGIKCLLVAMEDEGEQFLTAIRHGACGYVLQDASAIDVVNAVRAVAQGDAVCSPRLAKILFDYVVSGDKPRSGLRISSRLSLTRREQQLIPLISRGLTNKEIASHFSLSEQTVKNHIHRILRKVGVDDRLGVLEAYENQSLGL